MSRMRQPSMGIDTDMVSEFDPSSSDSGVVSRCAVVKPLKLRLCKPIFGRKTAKNRRTPKDKACSSKEHIVEQEVPRVQKPRDPEREKRRIARKKEKRATLILGLIMGSFIACWLPFFFMYILRLVCHIPGIAFSTAFWLGYMNSALNPVIYTIFNKDFRRAFRRILFNSLRGERVSTVRSGAPPPTIIHSFVSESLMSVSLEGRYRLSLPVSRRRQDQTHHKLKESLDTNCIKPLEALGRHLLVRVPSSSTSSPSVHGRDRRCLGEVSSGSLPRARGVCSPTPDKFLQRNYGAIDCSPVGPRVTSGPAVDPVQPREATSKLALSPRFSISRALILLHL
ncbi:hypothetical protein GEV33_012953 [Tenebrio molitor]|uniref:G-protein coupled receptors family 1 profile domain-containing protein n=1 Tax=Tenebrio molitor TaxID=7067 RepID=A0A8J6LEF1_TENMO|nr:hypothetical protein GEV33_012953 [Tenebrio molitor]